MWRKLHLAVDLASGEILGSALTTHKIRDASLVPGLLDQIAAELASLTADGAYDSRPVDAGVEQLQADNPIRVIIPPRRGARSSRVSGTDTSQRDANIRSMQTRGRRRWQKVSGYTRRSLVEAAISRYKRIMGRRLRNRTLPSQRTEVAIAPPRWRF